MFVLMNNKTVSLFRIGFDSASDNSKVVGCHFWLESKSNC
jgi:hypothetical protein